MTITTKQITIVLGVAKWAARPAPPRPEGGLKIAVRPAPPRVGGPTGYPAYMGKFYFIFLVKILSFLFKNFFITFFFRWVLPWTFF